MHVKARTMAFCGLLLALSVLCMALGSVIETSTFFLLAAASYFVGIVVREFGLRAGAAFYIAAVLLGFFIAPNKLYVLTFAAMGWYIWGIEAVWRWLERQPHRKGRVRLFWIAKYVVFNIVYLPAVFFLKSMLFPEKLITEMASSDSSGWLIMAGVIAAGQALLFVYDRAYDYAQVQIWNKLRGRMITTDMKL